MKNGPFNQIVAFALRMDAKSVEVVARHLKEAKPPLIRTGARGSNAPEMTPADLAALLLALLFSEKPAWAVERVSRAKEFQLSNDESAWKVASLVPDPDHTVLDFLTAICDPSFVLKPGLEITIQAVGQSHVSVEGQGLSLSYWHRQEHDDLIAEVANIDFQDLPSGVSEKLFNGPNSLHGLVTIRELKYSTIAFIKGLVFEANK
jgi:hypothetical protein